MASSSSSLALAAAAILLFLHPLAAASRRHFHHLQLASDPPAAPPVSSPTTFFEVSLPTPFPPPPPTYLPCSTLLLTHEFAFTYGRPAVTTPYSPPTCLLQSRRPSRAVLEFSSTCRGRQFDRIFGIWLAGAEILRSCTAEPRATGIFWSVRKDITKYSSLLRRNSTLAIYLGNLVDKTYTGVYHANVTLHLYFDSDDLPAPPPADLILPLSRSLPLNDGQWFVIQNSTDVHAVEITVPRNSYGAVLEVFVSFHQSDEFWYTNPPDDYIRENNLTGTPGNGAFREVVVTLDGLVVGAVWPFTVIYTGGINPLLWRPITGIGSFDLPTYDIEVTPFLGRILDGEPHAFAFRVTDALDVWFVDANLHIWLDPAGAPTTGELISHRSPELEKNLMSQFRGLDGNFTTTASRRISAAGWVNSSRGNLTTKSYQSLVYTNHMEFGSNGSVQVVKQRILSHAGVHVIGPFALERSTEVRRNFPLYIYTGITDQVNGTYVSVSNLTIGFDEKRIDGSGGDSGFDLRSVKNRQAGEATMKVKGNLVVAGVGSTKQAFRYVSTDGCYFREVGSRNYTILFDRSGDSCAERLAYGSAADTGVMELRR